MIIKIWNNLARFAFDLLKFYFSFECFFTILAWAVYLGFEEEWIPSMASHFLISCIVVVYLKARPSGPER